MTNNAPGCEPYAENRLFSCACARGVVWCVVWCVVMFVCVCSGGGDVCVCVRACACACVCVRVGARVPGSGRGGAGWSRPPRRCSRGPAAPAAPPPPAQSATGCCLGTRPSHDARATPVSADSAPVAASQTSRRQPEKHRALSPHYPVRVFSSSGADSAPVAASQTSRRDPSRFHPTSLLDARLYPHKLVRH